MDHRTGPFRSLDVTRHRLHEQIADNIQEIIAENRLAPGTQIPTEREFAEMLGVSRPTVRNGLRLLQQRGLVHMRVGSGTFVARMAPHVVAESMERYFLFSSSSAEDMLRLREILEPGVLTDALEKATEEDLSALQELVEKLERAFESNDASAYAEYDTAFHTALAKASQNELLFMVTSGLQRIVRNHIHQRASQPRIASAVHDHRALYESIAARDADRAQEIMTRMLARRRAAGDQG